MIDREFLDYYKTYCELTIWYKKLVLHTNTQAVITIKDIAHEFIAERNKILQNLPPDRRRKVRTKLNAIATSYYSRISHWSKQQKITIDMV